MIEKKSISYIPPGTTLQNNGTIYSLYSSPETLFNKIMEYYVIDYPWGCGEQTAAKLAGLGIMLAKSLPVESSHFLVKKIQGGIIALEKYKSENNFYGVFSKETASTNSTQVIYNNLRLLLPYRNKIDKLVPELWKMIDQMKETISQSVDRPSVDRKGRSQFVG